jgi:hypothetical protein
MQPVLERHLFLVGGRPGEQAFDADFLVERVPADTVAVTDETPVISFGFNAACTRRGKRARGTVIVRPSLRVTLNSSFEIRTPTATGPFIDIVLANHARGTSA